MEFISVREAAERWGIGLRSAQRYCASGRIPGAKRFGRVWAIPIGAERPCETRNCSQQLDIPKVYQGLFLLENMRLNGQSEMEISAGLPDDEHRREFFAELAFLQGKTEKSLELFARMPEGSPFRITCEYVKNIAAIRSGDYCALSRGMDVMQNLRREYACCPSALASIGLAEAVVYASVYAADRCPRWLKAGDVSKFPSDCKPFALYLYALYLNSTYQPRRMLGETEAVLKLAPPSGFTVAELYLQIMRINACVEIGERSRARNLVEQALEYAIPYGFFAPFSEHLVTMRGVLEEVARKQYPQAYKRIIRGWKEVFPGWTEIHNRILNRDITMLLSAREYQIALYRVDGKTYKEIATLMGTTLASVNFSLQVVREKLCVKKSRDIAKFVNWSLENRQKT